MAPKIICVVGPTACGKTTLGVRLAKQFNGEVVSVDSMQIYKGMTIGTAAPTEAEMDGVPHHMVAVAEPGEQWSAARYTEMAVPIIDDIIARSKQVYDNADHDHWFQLGIGGSLGGDSPSGVSNVLNPYVTTVVTTKMDTDPSPVGIVLMNHCTTTRTIVDSNGKNRTAIVGIDLVDAIIEMNGKFYLNRRGNDVVTGGDQNQGTQDPSTRSTGHATIGYEAF